VGAQFTQGLSVVGVQAVEQKPATGVSQGTEDGAIILHTSTLGNHMVACQADGGGAEGVGG